MGRRKKTVGVSTITGEDVGLPAKAADGGGGEAGRDEERMVMPEVKTCLLLVAVLAIQVVGVYLFTSGFLLTRNELPYVAACPPESALGGACMLPPSVSGPRGTPPYKRAVVVLIDALRFDFMAWDAGLEQAMAEQARKQDDRLADGDRVAFGGGVRVEPEPDVILTTHATETNETGEVDGGNHFVGDGARTLTDAQVRARSFHRNRMPIFRDVLESEPGAALLTRFVADAPTTTMQRLKAMTTGGLPTFIDVSANFDSSAITEDNWVAQLVAPSGRNGRLHFLGDDTWASLFPGLLSVNATYPSFNVKDLDTVDDGILAHLGTALANRSHRADDGREWDVLVAHFLGVDHAGHRYGSEHPEMTRKLEQMNEVVADVLAAVDNDTLVVVMGDHGMTADGNHGGGTDDEVTAGCFLYSKRRPFQWTPRPWAFGEGGLASSVNHAPADSFGSVMQVDIVPTLALGLGLPIPYGSLGRPIDGALCAGNNDEASCAARTLAAAMVSARLVQQYIVTYANEATSSFPVSDIEELTALLHGAEAAYAAYEKAAKGPHHDAAGVARAGADAGAALDVYFTHVQLVTRLQWAEFDTVRMDLGVAVLFGATLMLVAAVLARTNLGNTVALFQIYYPVVGASIAGPLAFLSTFDPILTSGVICLGFAAGFVARFVEFVANGSMRLARFSWGGVAAAAAMALHSYGLFSNSYILAEGSVVSFLAASLAVVAFRRRAVRKGGLSWPVAAQVAAVLAVLAYVRIWPPARQDDATCASGGDTTAATAVAVGRAVVVGLLLAVGAPWLVPREPEVPAEQHIKLLRSNVAKMLAVGVGVFWVLSALCVINDETRNWWRIYLPRGIYLFSAGAAAVLVWRPVGRDPKFFSVKGNFVCQAKGFATAPSGSYALVLLFLLVPVVMVLGATSALTIVALPVQLWLVLALVNASRFTRVGGSKRFKSGKSNRVLVLEKNDEEEVNKVNRNVPVAVAVLWALLASSWFFGTGNRMAFDSIDWSAAFVGFDETSYGVRVFNGALVALSTFGALWICVLATPLLALSTNGEERGFRDVAGDQRWLRFLARPLAAVQLWFTLGLACTALFVRIERRHLMTFRVFAPKYVYDAVLAVSVNVVLLAALGLATRVVRRFQARWTACARSAIVDFQRNRERDRMMAQVDAFEAAGGVLGSGAAVPGGGDGAMAGGGGRMLDPDTILSMAGGDGSTAGAGVGEA